MSDNTGISNFKGGDFMALSERQEKFCKMVALYGLSLADAAKQAGYVGTCVSVYGSIGRRLCDNIHIASRIAELREEYFDVDLVRRSVVLRHMQAMDFKVTDIVHHKLEKSPTGRYFYRLIVKPYEDWDEVAKRMCIGFDKNNIPIFRNGCDAAKELARIFGLYKDNMIVHEQDTSGVLEGAGLTPSYTPVGKPKGYQDADFDGDAFDTGFETCEDPATYRAQQQKQFEDAFYEVMARCQADDDAEDISSDDNTGVLIKDMPDTGYYDDDDRKDCGLLAEY